MKTQLNHLIKSFINKLYVSLAFTPKMVEINKINCQKDIEFSDLLGFGGKDISYFPPYEFFKVYLKQPEKANILFYNWFYNTFLHKNAWKIPKVKGGWFKGPLYIAVEKLFKEKNLFINQNTILKNEDLIKQAIRQRISYYFNLVESIKKYSFEPSIDPVRVVNKNGVIYLLDGHHRVAILSILGYKKILVLKRTVLGGILEKLILIKKKTWLYRNRKSINFMNIK
ncbi:MAG: ParB N-terminal domain-containing protein [Promethearchaeota archaeon]